MTSLFCFQNKIPHRSSIHSLTGGRKCRINHEEQYDKATTPTDLTYLFSMDFDLEMSQNLYNFVLQIQIRRFSIAQVGEAENQPPISDFPLKNIMPPKGSTERVFPFMMRHCYRFCATTRFSYIQIWVQAQH